MEQYIEDVITCLLVRHGIQNEKARQMIQSFGIEKLAGANGHPSERYSPEEMAEQVFFASNNQKI